MATNDDNPITFGAVVEGKSPASATTTAIPLRPQPSNDSGMTAAKQEDTEHTFDSNNPYSAFYKHPSARRSLDVPSTQQSKVHLDVNVYERDLEANSVPLSAATTQQPKISVDGRVKECTMWPSRQTIMEKKKMSERAKGCSLFRSLNSKQRFWVKILIAALVVAAAVGLGIGISRAVGGGIWKSKGQTQGIA